MIIAALQQAVRALGAAFANLGPVLIQTLAYAFNPAVAHVVTRRSSDRDTSTLERRLEELAESMRRSSQLVEEVEAALTVRRAAVEQLQADAAVAQEIASLNQEQRDAVELLLRGTVAREGRKTFWLGALVNLIFFAAGAAVTLLIGK